MKSSNQLLLVPSSCVSMFSKFGISVVSINQMIGSAPSYINWNYTYACNLSCTHCYSRSPRYPNELPTSVYTEIARQIVDNNVFTVGFGGGEPTIRADLLDILSILASGGVNTNLTTNGTFLTKELILQLKEVGLGSILISIDSHDKSTNDAIRNFDGAFDIACEAARNSAKMGLKTMIACVATSQNYNNLIQVQRLASQLGVSGLNIKLFRASGGAVQSRHLYELNQEQKEELQEQLIQIKQSAMIEVQTYQNIDNITCSCGLTELTIRPNGDLSVCPYSSSVIGNLAQETLGNIWLNSQDLKLLRQDTQHCISTTSTTYPYNPSIPLTEIRK